MSVTVGAVLVRRAATSLATRRAERTGSGLHRRSSGCADDPVADGGADGGAGAPGVAAADSVGVVDDRSRSIESSGGADGGVATGCVGWGGGVGEDRSRSIDGAVGVGGWGSGAGAGAGSVGALGVDVGAALEGDLDRRRGGSTTVMSRGAGFGRTLRWRRKSRSGRGEASAGSGGSLTA
ncbi:MAG: hypothetical protein IPH38_00320 [Candidatus Microthrix sp.]|nr:hypothetical protein [Candidatus Microthrix sp.]MBK7018070.1 hypothetical protein [Candidatus Microthrix sp.]